MAGQNVGLPIFTDTKREFTCANGDLVYKSEQDCNGTLVPDHCHTRINGTLESCSSFNFDLELGPSVGSDFELVCESENKLDWLKMIYFTGSTLGPILGGHVSDTYGRKRAVILLSFSAIGAALACSFSPNWWVYGVLRLVCGAITSCAFQTGFVFGLEVVGPNYRQVI